MNLSPHGDYRVVTGQLAAYNLTPVEATVQVTGNPVAYNLSTLGAWPKPLETLPHGVSVTMWVNGTTIGMLDVEEPSQRWHIVTRGYVQPGVDWLYVALVDSLLLIIVPFLAVAVGRDIWRQHQHLSSTAGGGP
jgi:hypothetical protein